MTFLEIKSEKVYSLLAVLLLSGGIAIPVALKRWLPQLPRSRRSRRRYRGGFVICIFP